MKFWVPPAVFNLLVLFLLAAPPTVPAEDATVDQLLKKLPPPEKFVKSPTDRIILEARTLDNDRAVKQIVEALRFRNFGPALDLARDLAKRYPKNPIAQSVHGAIAYRMRQFVESGEAFHRAIALQPTYVEPYVGLGFIELAQSRPGAAIAHFQKFAELEPKQPGGWLLLSACHERLGEKQKAVEEAKHATQVSPASAGAWVQLARTEKAVGNTGETLRAILRAADLLPDSAYMMATVGYGYINLNRIPEAVGPLERAAYFAPNDFLIQSQLGFCLMTTGQTEAAIKRLRRGAELAPNYAPVWEHLGLAYSKQGRHRDAVTAFERATKIMPNYAQAWQHLAEEYRLVGQPADAEQAGLRAARLKNTSSSGQRKKG